MKVIIGSGKVSNVLKDKEDVVLSHKDIEVKSLDSVYKQLSRFPVGTVVVNTAAKINLEWCEVNREETHSVNVTGAHNVGNVCKDIGHHLVHISSGCIFDGMETEKVYTEEDTPTPACWYASTKAEADDNLMSLGYKKITIIRPRQLISAVPHPTNMLTKFATLPSGKFIDSKNSVTCIEDMKEAIDHLVSNNHYGIYNVANKDWLSPLQIAEIIKKEISPNLQVDKISYEDYIKTIRVKRVNTLLSINKLSKTGYDCRSAIDALEWCIKNYKKA